MDGHNEVKHTVEFYSVLQNKEVLTFATLWINPEDNMLSEIFKKQIGKSIIDSTSLRFLQESHSYGQWKEGGGGEVISVQWLQSFNLDNLYF